MRVPILPISKFCLGGSILLVLGLSAASAVTSYWNGNANPDPNWQTAGNWSNSVPPVAGNALTFGPVAAQTNTFNDFGANTNFGAITLDSSSNNVFTLSGNPIKLGGNITTINGGAGGHLISLDLTLTGGRTLSVNKPLTISGVIGENGTPQNLIKTGGAALTLTASNIFTGQFQINQGTVTVSLVGSNGVAGPLGMGLNVLRFGNTNNSGTLNYTGLGETTDRQIQLGNGTNSNETGSGLLTASGTNGIAFLAPAFNVPQTTATAARILTLNGPNTGTNVIEGVIADNSATGGTVGILKSGGGTWYLNGTNTFTGPLVVRQNILNVSSIASNGMPCALGAGTAPITIGGTNLGGNLTYTGGDASTDRQLQIGSGSTVNDTGSATLYTTGTSTLFFNNPTFNVPQPGTLVTRTLTLGNGGNGQILGTIQDNDPNSGILNVTKSGGGTWSLFGTNTFTGLMAINSGTIQVYTVGSNGLASPLGQGTTSIRFGNAGNTGTLNYLGAGETTDRQLQIGSGTGASVTGGATLTAGGTGALVFNNPALNVADLTAATNRTLTINGASSDDNQIQGVIADNNPNAPVSVYKWGTGTWILSGANTFTGLMAINQGTLKVGVIGLSDQPSPLGAGSLIRFGNGANLGTLTYTGPGETTDRQIQVGSGTGTGGGAITCYGTGPLVFSNSVFNVPDATALNNRILTLQGTNTGANEVQGIIADNNDNARVGVTKSGAGNWILSGANTYSGGTIVNNTAGTLELHNGSALGTGPVTLVSANNGTGTSASCNLALANDITVANPIQLGLRNNNNEAVANLSGNNVLTGDITGYSLLADQGSTNNRLNISSDAGTLTLQGNFTDSSTNAHTLQLQGLGTGVFNGSIADGANPGATTALKKMGIGTWTLSGTNTYTGPTTVSAGTLLVNGSLAGSAVIVGTNATLGGAGSLAGPLTVQPGGTLAPAGSGIGFFTVNSTVTLGGVFQVKVNRSGSLSDQLVVGSGGSVTLGGVLNVVNLGEPLQMGDTFTVITGPIAGGSFVPPAAPGPGLTWDLSQLTPTGNGTIKAVAAAPAGVATAISTAYIDGSGNLILAGTNVTGVAGGSYSVLTSTNVSAPLSAWTTNTGGSFGDGGSFSNSVTANPAEPQRFFLIKTP